MYSSIKQQINTVSTVRGQQSPWRQGGLHGNPAMTHLQAPVNTALGNCVWKKLIYLAMNTYVGGNKGVREQAVLAEQMVMPLETLHIEVTA